MVGSLSPLGEIVTLRSGDSLAEFTTVGAHLRRFQVGERNVIVPFGDNLPWGAHGAILAPWPNRIDGGTYSWEGAVHHLEITEPERNTAIHGLVMAEPWIPDVADNRVMFTLSLGPRTGYPFPLRLTLRYQLDGPALTADFTAENMGTVPAPFGVGFHPWLAAGPGGIEAATLQMQAGTWFRPDSRLLPIAEELIPERFDFHHPATIGDVTFDDAFGHPRRDDSGRAWIKLTGDDGVRVGAWMNYPFQVWQLCSHPGPAPRPGLAAEPMTCPANAFKSGDRLHVLAPRKPFRAQWGLTCERRPT